MKNYIENLIKQSGLNINPEATKEIEKAVTCYIEAFIEEAKEIDSTAYVHDYDIYNGIELSLLPTEQAIIKQNTKTKYFQGVCQE